MLETDLKYILEQIIDNQLNLNNKIDKLTEIAGKLTNTIIKYDDDYQQKIVEEMGARVL
jgi:hypothetical protein